jgi:hypothetical protein
MDIWQQMVELEPFLRHIGIEAETLGPDQAILRLPVRREITYLGPFIPVLSKTGMNGRIPGARGAKSVP